MKPAPGSPKPDNEVLGRAREIAELWRELEGRSVLFSAERRVGKTCILNKMTAHPRNGYAVIKCTVESDRHPAELVRKVSDAARQHSVLSRGGAWLQRFKKAYQTLAGTELKGFRLPQVRAGWKTLLICLIGDMAENSARRVLIVLDELPQMVSNVINAGEPAVAMELLDTLREIRQSYESSGKIRFLLAGSIGLHLIIDELKRNHGYKGSPTNDMALATLSGMAEHDVALMCEAYLDKEGIVREEPARFDRRMWRVTDGLPLYVAYLCERFHAAGSKTVGRADIDREFRAMLDSQEVDWFQDAARRIDTHYSRLGADRAAHEILRHLCQQRRALPEPEILDHVRSQMTVEHDDTTRRVLELLCKDHYLRRRVASGLRRYRFQYEIMRRWWRHNRG